MSELHLEKMVHGEREGEGEDGEIDRELKQD